MGYAERQNPRHGLPIVGQPCAFKGYFGTVMIQCNCELKTPLMIVAQSVVQCPGCQRKYTVNGIMWKRGQPPAVEIGLVLTPPNEASKPLQDEATKPSLVES